VRAAVGAVVAERNQAGLGVEIDAVFLVRKVRLAGSARGNNQIGGPAIGGEPDEVGTSRDAEVKRAVVAVVGVAAQRDDAVAVGRPRRIAIESGCFCKNFWCATGGRNFQNLPAGSGPGDVSD